ncbi:MAG TPA: glycosyltransferase family 39 protein, partial [Roseiflexaceae bacterium]
MIRLYNLGVQSLWLDEGGTWAEITSRGWPALLADLWNAKAAYPFYHLLLKAWVGVAGDSEWALRFPSALAGAGAVVAIYLAATELRRRPTTDSTPPHPFIAAILLTTSPFALWYAQDAKVYSLLILVVALELWALLRAFRRNDRRAWLLVFIVAVVSLFVHRLALLAAAGVALAYLMVWPADERRSPSNGISHFAFHVSRTVFAAVTLVLVAGGVVGLIIGVSGESQGTGGHIPAGPLQGLWLSFAHFGADRGDIAGVLGLPLLAWILPCIALMLWGLALLVRDAARRDPAAIAVLCLFAAPLALLTAALAIMPVYEARYATVAFPAWILVLAYPFVRPSPISDSGSSVFVVGRWSLVVGRWSLVVGRWSFVGSLLLGALFLVNAMVLFQPKHGLFSGAPVKEQWREAIGELAHQAHPDDLIILHPYFVAPLWGYYTPRVTPDPLPQPVTFPIFAGGFCSEAYTDPVAMRECIRREYNEPIFNEKALGKKRML